MTGKPEGRLNTPPPRRLSRGWCCNVCRMTDMNTDFLQSISRKRKQKQKPRCICGCPERWHGDVLGRGTACESCGKCHNYLPKPHATLRDWLYLLALTLGFFAWLTVAAYVAIAILGWLF